MFLVIVVSHVKQMPVYCLLYSTIATKPFTVLYTSKNLRFYCTLTASLNGSFFLNFVLGPLACLTIRINLNYGSYKRLLGLLGCGISPVARTLPTHKTTQTQKKRGQTYIPRVGFERAETFHALDHAATVIGVNIA
jgi:hypothetical protein